MFEAVARLGVMGRAAEALHTVQSNVTARIRRLEEELEHLCSSAMRGVEPTPAGRRLLPYARQAARLLEDARRATLDDGTPQGPLVIGSLETTAALRLAPVLTAFAATYPAVDLTLRTGTTCELLDAVLAHRVEGAFVCGPVVHPELEVGLALAEDLVLLDRAGRSSPEDLFAMGEYASLCSGSAALPAAPGRRAGATRHSGAPGAGVWHAGSGVRVRRSRSRRHPTAARAGRAGVAPGRVALHALPLEEARAETVFVQQRDGHRSSALAAFLEVACHPAQALKVAAE